MRKHDLFKIISKTLKTVASNPGADKREKGVLGQIIQRLCLTLIRRLPLFLGVLNANDTGGAEPTIPSLRRKGGVSKTQLL